MTDQHIILTESGVRKARSVHRVPLEERFVATELNKVQGLPSNGATESLQGADRDTAGPGSFWASKRILRRAGLWRGLVRRMVAVGVSDLGLHTEACRARLEKAVVDHKMGAGVLGARVGPIAEESKASEEKEACDARTGEKLDQEEVWKERAKMV